MSVKSCPSWNDRKLGGIVQCAQTHACWRQTHRTAACPPARLNDVRTCDADPSCVMRRAMGPSTWKVLAPVCPPHVQECAKISSRVRETTDLVAVEDTCLDGDTHAQSSSPPHSAQVCIDWCNGGLSESVKLAVFRLVWFMF